jgi:hypothetical protein
VDSKVCLCMVVKRNIPAGKLTPVFQVIASYFIEYNCLLYKILIFTDFISLCLVARTS